MNDFNVSLKIEDCTYSCNCKNCNSSTDTITNVSQTISLQGNYILNVIAVNNNFATILIQNGYCNSYSNYKLEENVRYYIK